MNRHRLVVTRDFVLVDTPVLVRHLKPLEGQTGFEPATSSFLQIQRRSTRLSYCPQGFNITF